MIVLAVAASHDLVEPQLQPDAMIATMRRVIRTLPIMLTLALWVVSGPIGMAFDGCAMMGTMCEASCGISSHISGPVPTDLVRLEPLAYLASPSTARTLVASTAHADTASQVRALLRVAF